MQRLVPKLILLFLLAQLLGIFTGFIIFQDYTENPYVSSMVVTADASNPANAFLFGLYILIGAAVMILLIKKFKLYDFIFLAMEFVLIAVASSIVFYSFLRLSFGFEISTIGGIILGLGLSASRRLWHDLKNFAAVMATAGVGVIFGISLAPLPAILFLIFLSFYDYISVFITKHMVEFADFIIKKDLAFTVTSKGIVDGKPRRIDLGTGDLIAPILFEVSVLPFSPIATLFVFAGALISLAVFLFLVWKKRIVLPALPPLVFGMLLFFFLGMILGFY